MSQAAAEARMLASIYRRHGRAATLSPPGSSTKTPLTVRPAIDDEAVSFGPGETLLTRRLFAVRVSEAPSVHDGARIEVAKAGGGMDAFDVIAEPRRVTQGLEWLCEVRAVA